MEAENTALKSELNTANAELQKEKEEKIISESMIQSMYALEKERKELYTQLNETLQAIEEEERILEEWEERLRKPETEKHF